MYLNNSCYQHRHTLFQTTFVRLEIFKKWGKSFEDVVQVTIAFKRLCEKVVSHLIAFGQKGVPTFRSSKSREINYI